MNNQDVLKEVSKVLNFPKSTQLSTPEFEKMRELIRDLCGINLADHKMELLRARLFKRLRELNLESFTDYYEYLTTHDKDGIEKIEFMNAVSTNKTEFFREARHFEFLKTVAFPELENRPLIRILCAGCSTGEEPYTMAMTAHEYFGKAAGLKVRIDAVDINTHVLDRACAGIYKAESVATLSRERTEQFFLKGTGAFSGMVQVKPELKSMIEFRRHNLMERLPYTHSFNLLFCRNVVIYFDRPTQEQLFKRFCDALLPLGYLFLGHSESLIHFKLPVKYIQPSVYQRKTI